MIIKKLKNAKVKFINWYNCYKERKKINCTDFSIISNNYWGGFVYQKFGIKYTSPTVGLLIYENDYVKFCSDLKGYFAKPLHFIDVSDSKYYDLVTQGGTINITYPIARLGDIEVFFMHYKSKEEAQEKWNRRKSRINYDRLLVKMSQRNDCDDETVKRFCELELKNKICFTQWPYLYDCCTTVKELKGLVGDETEYTLKCIDI